MTSAYVTRVVQTVLAETGVPDTLLRVTPLPFSWEVTLRNPSGIEHHVIVPDGPPRTLTDTLRSALAPDEWS